MHWLLLLIPFISACMGWMANGILIRSLFHPKLPKKIAGFTFQGLLPKLQPVIARKIGKFAVTELFSPDVIEQKITNPENLEEIMPAIEIHMDEFLRVKLGQEMPVINMFIGDKTIESMKKIFMQELRILFPQVMKSYVVNLKTEIDIEKMVREKIANFPQTVLEDILFNEMSMDFRKLKMIGAATGFLIGLIQILLTFVLF